MTTGLLARLHSRDDRFCTIGTRFDRNFDAEIAARDHDPVGGLDDLVEIVERFVLFDLRDHGNVVLPRFAMNALTRATSSARADERERDVVDAVFQAELEELEIALGHRRDVERAVGIVDALRCAQVAAELDDRLDFGRASSRRCAG